MVNGCTTSGISNLAGGIYSVSVTDEIGCISVAEATVVEPSQLGIDVDDTETSCGATNGILTVAVTGGTPNFSLVWENGETTATITVLAADTYSLSVTDANSCSQTFDIYLGVDDEVPPTASANNITLELDANGQAVIQPSDVDNGSTDNCQIESYSLGQTVFNCSDLGENTVSFSVMDVGLNTTSTNIIVTVQDNTAPVLNLLNATLSIGSSGTATLTPSLIDNGSTDNCGIASWVLSQTSFDCSDVGANTVEVTASDMMGNAVSGTVVVTVTETTPPTINCPANLALPSCNPVAVFDVTASDNCVGPVSLTQTAGLPSGSNFPSGTTTVSFSATDISGNTSTCSFTVTASAALAMGVSSVNVDCNGDDTGSATANPNGGTAPFNYTWSNGATTQTASNLIAGGYTVSATDVNGCSATQSVTITQPPVLATALVNIINATNNQANGSIDVNVNGGVQPYSYTWLNSTGTTIGTMQDISGLAPGTYTLSVMDANGCVSLSGYTIQNSTGTNEEELGRHVMLYPNPTTARVTLEVDLPNIGSISVSAFDVTGRNVLPQTNIGSKHTLDFSNLPGGVYMLKIVIGETTLSKRLVVTK
ncbi:MAG: T9SS type A sorting domain-containing protein [Saprospiraceae bacterium]|nr:T9SS type A sorting domain-containing protein [Saprospiraceae bacterium]